MLCDLLLKFSTIFLQLCRVSSQVGFFDLLSSLIVRVDPTPHVYTFSVLSQLFPAPVEFSPSILKEVLILHNGSG